MNKNILSINTIDNVDFASAIGKAILFDLLQIGELVNAFPDEFLALLNEKDVKGVIGTRNIIVHGYDKLKRENIIKSIKYGVPSLLEQINTIGLEQYEKGVKKLLDQKIDIFINEKVGDVIDGEKQDLNLGYADEIISPDGQFIDVWILDVKVPLRHCSACIQLGLRNPDTKEVILLATVADVALTQSEIDSFINKYGYQGFEIIKK